MRRRDVRRSDIRLQTGDVDRTVSFTCGGSHDVGGISRLRFAPLEMTGRFIVPPLVGERWYAVPKGDERGLRKEV